MSKATGTFGSPSALSTTYTPTLKLSDLTPATGYAWDAPTTAITSAGDGKTFPATYTDPSGNYNPATGNITVNVAKASGLSANTVSHQMISKGDLTANTFDLSTITLNKGDHGALSYSLGAFADVGGSNNILAAQPTLDGHTLTYTGTGKDSLTATQVINISSDNYNTIQATITFEAIPKQEVVIAITEQSSIDYNGSEQKGYTGTPSGTIKGTTTPYTGSLEISYAGAGYGPTSTPPTNAGEYTLDISVPSDNAFYTGEYRHEFVIAKVKIAKPAVATATTLTYNGTEQTAAIAANAAYTITGNKGTAAGPYTATVALNDKANYEWADGTTADLPLQWTISKATYDLAGVSFPSQSLTYTGEPQSILISGTLPAGVTVSYTGNGQTAINETGYAVTATFAGDTANYEPIPPLTATMIINNKQTYDLAGITFADKTAVYDGTPQSILISGTLPDGVTVSYTGNGQTAVGTYTITATFAVANPATHNTPAPKTAELKIVEPSSSSSEDETPSSSSSEEVTPSSSSSEDVTPSSSSIDTTPSSSSGTETPIFTNRENPRIGRIGVQTTANSILLSNLPPNAKVEVYNLQGKRIYSSHSGNSQILKILVQTGVYVVKTNTQTTKIAVK
ncbi:hypothetical protein R83H12_00857 [Fibrobacteria bacterium R8-3-H12]